VYEVTPERSKRLSCAIDEAANMNTRRWKKSARFLFTPTLLLLLNLFLTSDAASQAPPALEPQKITLGLIAEAHHKEIEAHFHDFIGYVAQRLSAGSKIEGRVSIAVNVADLANRLVKKEVDLFFESPYPTYIINNVHGAGKLLLRRWKNGMVEYRSLVFTARNSGINRLQELRGRTVAFEDPESTSGYFLPKFFLQRNGFKLSPAADPKSLASSGDMGYVFAKSQDKLLDMVLKGEVAAGAFSDDDYSVLDEKRKTSLTILAQTESLPRHLVSARKDLNPQLIERLGLILLSMNDNDPGRTIMRQTDGTTQFDPLPGGEEAMRRRLLETFFSPERR
jgi:phosphonate transport system substrate-binding protein